MTYEEYQEHQAELDQEFWAWVEEEMSRRICSNCRHWQPTQKVRGQVRPGHCWAMAELERECYKTSAENCRLFKLG